MGTVRKAAEVVQAGGHPVILGAHALDALQHWLSEAASGLCSILVDSNTLHHCLPVLLKKVPALVQAHPIEVSPGERAKELEVCRELWGHLSRAAAGRDAVLVNLGGGVITDLGGFVAGSYKRGIRCINVPTTLMGMVDAAIGGKTAIDEAGIKNLVGLFHDPVGVYVHVPFLRTLGKRELLNGLAEMMKHALVHDAVHWEAIREAPLHDLEALAPLIARSASIKAEIVRADPRDEGSRRKLNFGHTIGHALEALSWESAGRSLLHGEAVAAGMVAEGWLSWRTGLLPRGDFDTLAAQILSLYAPIHFGQGDHHRLIELMRNDKKNRAGTFRFTLLRRIGEAEVDVELTAVQVTEALDHYRERVRDGHAHHHPEA